MRNLPEWTGSQWKVAENQPEVMKSDLKSTENYRKLTEGDEKSIVSLTSNSKPKIQLP